MKSLPTAAMSSIVLLLAACGPRQPSAETPQPAPAQPTAPAPQEPAPATVESSRWRCGELLLTAAFPEQRAELAFSGRKLTLPIARSGSGARYADDSGNEFWTKGDQGTLTLAGEEKRDCASTTDVSPWEEARSRGVVLRAVGQEPGWWAEVGAGDSPPLHAELDYGERKIDVAKTQGISSTHGFGGQLDDGTAVVLRTWQEPCSDAMSGERFEHRVELAVGDRVYKGCGAYLDR